MKAILRFSVIFILSIICIGNLSAQYVVINDSGSGGNYIPFQDTILSSIDPEWGSCTTVNYFVDLDGDSIDDVDFYLECYMGGFGSHYKMFVTPLNEFSIHIDTGYLEHFQFIDTTGQVQDSTRKTTVVKKYLWGDTVFNNQTNSPTEEKLLYYTRGNDPWCVFDNIDLFLEDTSYIALNNNNGGIYYIKIEVPSRTLLELIYAKTNTVFSVHENEFVPDLISPNPAKDAIRLRGKYDFIGIYTLQGTLLYKESATNHQAMIDISALQCGFYILVLEKENTKHMTKLIKR